MHGILRADEHKNFIELNKSWHSVSETITFQPICRFVKPRDVYSIETINV